MGWVFLEYVRVVYGTVERWVGGYGNYSFRDYGLERKKTNIPNIFHSSSSLSNIYLSTSELLWSVISPGNYYSHLSSTTEAVCPCVANWGRWYVCLTCEELDSRPAARLHSKISKSAVDKNDETQEGWKQWAISNALRSRSKSLSQPKTISPLLYSLKVLSIHSLAKSSTFLRMSITGHIRVLHEP